MSSLWCKQAQLNGFIIHATNLRLQIPTDRLTKNREDFICMMLSYLNWQNVSVYPHKVLCFQTHQKRSCIDRDYETDVFLRLFQPLDHIPDLGAPSMARTLASVFEVLDDPKCAERSKERYEDFGWFLKRKKEKERKSLKRDEKEREEERVQRMRARESLWTERAKDREACFC